MNWAWRVGGWLLAGMVVAGPGAARPAEAWTARCQEDIAGEAARLAPPDLYRQLVRNREAYLQGARAGLGDSVASHHFKHEDGSGELDAIVLEAITNSIRAIEQHRPFNEIAYRLGLVSFYLAEANHPLHTSQGDRRESEYYRDFADYLESARPRIELVFYGFRARFGDENGLRRMLGETLARSRGLYPLVGREYRRVGFASGRRSFDDRSTAYGIAALSFSHAVSDIAEALRYIWLRAGGTDSRARLPVRGRQIVRIDRSSTVP